jgi:Fic family protein
MIEMPPKLGFDSKTVLLVKDSHFAPLLRTINNNYYYWDKVKYKPAENISAKELWNVVKLSRAFNYLQQSFGKYIFQYYTTERFQELLHYFDMNIGGNMLSGDIVPEKDKMRYLISSLMEEAISSSKMEGANTTRKKAKEMLRKEITPRNRSEQMILNNYLTIEHVTQNKNDSLTPENLLYIHKLITNKTLDKKEEEGYFRNTNDIYVVNTSTSEAVHTPPNYEEIPELINELCFFFNSDKQFVHPIIKGIIIHFMIGWIHPFSDGNGRTARSLFYWYLLKKGYWLTEYLSISRIISATKSQYEAAYLYTESDDNDLNYFISYNLNAMQKAFEALKKYIEIKQQEITQAKRFVKKQGINERQSYLLKKIHEEPDIVFTVKEIERRFSVSNFTARADLAGLVKMGYLEEIQVNKTKRNYGKSEMFDNLVSENSTKKTS